VSDEPRPGLDRPLRLLLVDDEHTVRATVLDTLKRAGLDVEVVEAHDVESARAAMTSATYDCLLIDEDLTHGDGHEVLEAAWELGVSTPAIMLTPTASEPLAKQLMRRGPAEYLPKSLVSPELLVHGIVHAVHADALQRREAEARDELAQHTLRLQRLVEASVRIHASTSVDEVVQTTASEALSLFDADAVKLEIDAYRGGEAIVRTATRDTPMRAGVLGGGRALTQPLFDARIMPFGAITLLDATLRETDASLLAQLARTATSAVESLWLLRAATDASRQRDEMLAVISHDLRSPLGTVSMGAVLLRQSLSTRGPALADDLGVVQRIERACRRMDRLIEDLLDASKLDQGTFVVVPRPKSAADLVGEALESAAVTAATAGVALRALHVDTFRVMADRSRMQQVFANLVGNALKFTARGGEVSLSAAPDGRFGRFTVSDNGAGIAREHLPRLFDRYWKGATDLAGGHGLGLYIARGIIEAHRGTIEVSSDEGRGTTFTFTLPLAP
jgi:signal transduction histidine kinase